MMSNISNMNAQQQQKPPPHRPIIHVPQSGPTVADIALLHPKEAICNKENVQYRPLNNIDFSKQIQGENKSSTVRVSRQSQESVNRVSQGLQLLMKQQQGRVPTPQNRANGERGSGKIHSLRANNNFNIKDNTLQGIILAQSINIQRGNMFKPPQSGLSHYERPQTSFVGVQQPQNTRVVLSSTWNQNQPTDFNNSTPSEYIPTDTNYKLSKLSKVQMLKSLRENTNSSSLSRGGDNYYNQHGVSEVSIQPKFSNNAAQRMSATNRQGKKMAQEMNEYYAGGFNHGQKQAELRRSIPYHTNPSQHNIQEQNSNSSLERNAKQSLIQLQNNCIANLLSQAASPQNTQIPGIVCPSKTYVSKFQMMQKQSRLVSQRQSRACIPFSEAFSKENFKLTQKVFSNAGSRRHSTKQAIPSTNFEGACGSQITRFNETVVPQVNMCSSVSEIVVGGQAMRTKFKKNIPKHDKVQYKLIFQNESISSKPQTAISGQRQWAKLSSNLLPNSSQFMDVRISLGGSLPKQEGWISPQGSPKLSGENTFMLKPKLQHNKSSPDKLTHEKVFDYLGKNQTFSSSSSSDGDKLEDTCCFSKIYLNADIGKSVMNGSHFETIDGGCRYQGSIMH
ncbi:hypothetical protein FGO68_gene12796 [Halteria grandinella]|uniref:Uncharacterized protein n=1 Tax=Halteria grandinella TaxID=5974 RepID=A0A8J8NS31_HALGN|nr:hypothetical protein FGO68_gene12796 [Halteria grandinella]